MAIVVIVIDVKREEPLLMGSKKKNNYLGWTRGRTTIVGDQ
jgi:hypothetical protein